LKGLKGCKTFVWRVWMFESLTGYSEHGTLLVSQNTLNPQRGTQNTEHGTLLYPVLILFNLKRIQNASKTHPKRIEYGIIKDRFRCVSDMCLIRFEIDKMLRGCYEGLIIVPCSVFCVPRYGLREFCKISLKSKVSFFVPCSVFRV